MKCSIGLFILFIALLFNSSTVVAQITIDADPRLVENIAKKASKQIGGYRIQICFDSDKSIIDEARNRFISMYPKIDTYVTFEAPNFNLMVGDFRTLIDAEKIQEEIAGKFTVVIIHKTQINLPRID
jgi:hypothetical protein